MIRIEHNVETGEISQTEMDNEEISKRAEEHKKIEAEDLAIVQKEATRLALLTKLGLTEEEAKILLS